MVKLEFFPDSENYNHERFKSPKLHSIEDPLLELVLRYKQDFSKVTVVEPVSLDDLLKENIDDKLVNFPKREVLGDEFTDEDYQLLCSKLRLQSEQFKNHQLRDVTDKVERLKVTFPRLTLEEIFTALKGFEFNEDEVTLYLTKSEFIAQIRQQIAQFRQKKNNYKNPADFTDITESMSMESSQTNDLESESDEEDEDEVDSNLNFTISNSQSPNVQKRSKNLTKKVSRLKLDDALANATFMEGWSDARIRAYQSLKTNPNTYFYRFNAPGETQKNGGWSKEEHELFMKRLAEVGADGQWGIFSMAISGRVGYQCSNYYRKLIESGSLKDSSYRMDEKGKAHYIGGKTREKSVYAVAEPIEDASESEIESEGEDDDEEEVPTTIAPLVTRPALFYENPLPGFVDAITKTEVVRPAISPYGHVLSYDTWMKCLLNGDRKNTCPLTNQPVNKRQLIFLTFENIEAYRDQIRKE